MTKKTVKYSCPHCGNQIIDTRNTVQPYSDFDNYVGFRCNGCNVTFTDNEIATNIKYSSTIND